MEFPEFSPDYCPDCGGELGSKHRDGKERLYCGSCDRIIWLNPDIAAGFIVRKDDEVLLQQRKISPHAGKWSIPAGFLELDEKPAEGGKRELEEETGLKATGETEFIDHVLLTHPDGRRVLVAVYYVELKDTEGEIEMDRDEVEKLEFWSFDEVVDRKEELDYDVYLDLIEQIR
jgi:8-oxo-dGTP diphosphatase